MTSTQLDMNYGLVDLSIRCGRPEWALRLAQPLLKRQDASTQWYVGYIHHFGFGVDRDPTIARTYYEKAAQQGFSSAQFSLCELDIEGNTGDHAINEGSVSALYKAQLGFDEVRCSAQQCETVFRDLLKGAVEEDVDAQNLVGMCYEAGLHVSKDWDTALEWYRRAAVEGSEEGCALYADLSLLVDGEDDVGDRLETKVTCVLARSRGQTGVEPLNHEDAIAWRLEGAAAGDRYACWRLHELYLLGSDNKKNREESAKWLIRACEGHSDEAVRRYFRETRRRIAEVIDVHSVDVALRHEVKVTMAREVEFRMASQWGSQGRLKT